MADYGVFILPPMSTPFRYSGQPNFSNQESGKYKKFNTQTGIKLEPNCGIDTAVHKDDWKGTSIITEIVVCDFKELEVIIHKEPVPVTKINKSQQATLFDALEIKQTA
jgi:hypothetical protein